MTTIDFGIDLGTTNSAIAKLEATGPVVLKNSDETEVTPSVVRVDARGAVTVGRRARQHLEVDPGNTRAEFKRLMGTKEELVFEKAGKAFSPESLSAEVLKSLRADARDRTGVDVEAAVITVPALFELSQSEATVKAAQLAGLRISPLLQEPIAAAVACGFSGSPTDGYWLVYDLGGGTFDTSLMSAQDGRMRVVDHAGDNFLGGKDFDWKLVELVIAQIQKQYSLPELKRGNAKYARALARLKAAGEEAKIELSRRELASVQVAGLCQDESGTEVDVDVSISRADYERLILPSVERSVAIVTAMLTKEGLDPSALGKLIFVGGPTMTPLIRETVERTFGIKAEANVDPMTVVARGAAIFAGTMPLEAKVAVSVPVGACTVQLEYPRIAQDIEPYLVGRISSEANRPSAIEVVRDDEGWTSGRIVVDQKGGFMVPLMLRERRSSRFTLRATSATGSPVQLSPSYFDITHGMTISDASLSRTVGVALASNETKVYFEKGTVLPARKTFTHKSVETLRPGSMSNLLAIPVVQGESMRSDRNRKVGDLTISASGLKRPLPSNSDIEVTLELDRSGLIRAHAFVPLLNEVFEEVVRTSVATASPAVLMKELNAEHDRLDQIRFRATNGGHEAVLQALRNGEAQLLDAEVLLQAAMGGDIDSGQKGERALQELQAHFDAAEDALIWPELEEEARSALVTAQAQVIKHGLDAERSHLYLLERELSSALAQRRPDAVEDKTERLLNLATTLYFKNDDAWEDELQSLSEDAARFDDVPRAGELIAEGRRAQSGGDISQLKKVVRQLWELRSVDQRERVRGFNSGIK